MGQPLKLELAADARKAGDATRAFQAQVGLAGWGRVHLGLAAWLRRHAPADRLTAEGAGLAVPGAMMQLACLQLPAVYCLPLPSLCSLASIPALLCR